MEENVRPTISPQHPGQPPGSAAFNAVSTSYHIPPSGYSYFSNHFILDFSHLILGLF